MEKKRIEYRDKVRKSGVLSDKQFKCFEYILTYGPITTNELIDKIVSREGEDDAFNTMSWNKIPSQLEDCKVIKEVDKRQCKSTLTKSDTKVKVWDVTYEKPERIVILSSKVKSLVYQSQHAALLAVEIYNKPSVKFKSEGYVTLMMIAWTKALHAFFHKSGISYYYKEEGKYILNEDGDRKTWDISKCLREYKEFSEAVLRNLEVHLKIRNRIVHGDVNPLTFDTIFFPECQSVLYNLENFLVANFGDAYAINHTLAYSLQFSSYRTDEQNEAIHKLSSVKEGKLFEFLDLFRGQLSNEVYNSPEYGIRLISIPQISNSGRNGVPIEFINWENLNDYQKEELTKVHALIKTKKEILKVSNTGKKKASDIQRMVSELISKDFNQYNFQCFCYVYSIRPYKKEERSKGKIAERYCAYDELHKDYVYEPALADLIARCLLMKKETLDSLKDKFQSGSKENLKGLMSALMEKV